MAVQILSDLHLEAPKSYDVFEITPKAPTLALLGDIGTIGPHKKDYLDFLVRQLKQFRTVLLVPGNHEVYHSTWAEGLEVLRQFEKETRGDASLGEFVLLDRQAFKVPGTNTLVLGCSFFSSILPEREQDVSFGLNDFFMTENWDTGAHNAAHQRDLAWLNAEVAKAELSDVDIVIFTHWSPSMDARAVDPRHAASPISSAFSTEMSAEPCFNSGKVKLWAFGHTHYNCDFEVSRDGGAGSLRLLANQRGYYFAQSEGFKAEMVVEMK